VHLLEGIAEYQKRERRYGGLAVDAAGLQGHRSELAKVSRAGAPAPHTIRSGRS
jgi:hypothetical protein